MTTCGANGGTEWREGPSRRSEGKALGPLGLSAHSTRGLIGRLGLGAHSTMGLLGLSAHSTVEGRLTASPECSLGGSPLLLVPGESGYAASHAEADP